MFGLEALDVALGLVLLYLVLALVCTAVNELLATLLNLRGATLRMGIKNLLRIPAGAAVAPTPAAAPAPGPTPSAAARTITLADIYNNPVIRGLYGGRDPSYIPSARFAVALLDTLVPTTAAAAPTIPALVAAVNRLSNDELKRALLILIAGAGNDLTKLQRSVAEWFDQSMDRVSGWYKRRLQWITLSIAALVTAGANADSISVARALSTDGALRQAIVAQAQAFAQRPPPAAASPARDSISRSTVPLDSLERALAAKMGTSIHDLESLGLPLGWSRGAGAPDLPTVATKVLGLLLTVFAVSLGAPFWFDALSKVMSVRGAGGVPQSPSQTQTKPAT